MIPVILTHLPFVLLAILMQAFYTGSEMSLYTVNRFRLRRRAHRGERSARVLVWLLSDPVGLLITFLLGTNISVYTVSALITRLYELSGLAPGSGRVLFTAEACATATLILPLFLSEVLTKNFVRRYAEQTSYVFSWGLAITKIALFVLVWPLRTLVRLVPARHGAGASLGLPQLTRHIIDHLLSRGRETGELTAEQERLARNALRAGEVRVAKLARRLDSSCCTPESERSLTPGLRTLTVPADEIAGRTLQRLIASRARLALVLARAVPEPKPDVAQPAHRTETAEVVGYVRLSDLLAPGAQSKAVRGLARPVPRLGARTTLRVALNTMQRECAEVALVELPTAGGSTKRQGGTGAIRISVPGVVRLSQLIGELLKSSAGVAPDAPAPPAN